MLGANGWGQPALRIVSSWRSQAAQGPSIPFQNSLQRGRVQHTVGPEVELVRRGLLEPRACFRRQRAEAAGELAREGPGLPLADPLLEAPGHALAQTVLGGKAFDARDVPHAGLPFMFADIFSELVLVSRWQVQHPVEHGKEVEHALAAPALAVQHLDELPFGGVAPRRLAAGAQGQQVRGRPWQSLTMLSKFAQHMEQEPPRGRSAPPTGSGQG